MMKLLPILEYGKFCETKGGRFRVSQLCLGGLAWFCRGFTSVEIDSRGNGDKELGGFEENEEPDMNADLWRH